MHYNKNKNVYTKIKEIFMNTEVLYNVADVMLQKKGKVLVPNGKYDSQDDLRPVIATMAHILLSRGFLMSDTLVSKLLKTKMSSSEMADYCQMIINANDTRLGYRWYKPFYTGFPEEVMNADDATLVINAILHYVSGGTIVPNTNFQEDIYMPISRMFDATVSRTSENMIMLDACTMEDFYIMCENMMASRTSISEYDKEILTLLIKCDIDRVPVDMPHKENKSVVIATMLNNKVYEHPLYSQINSATDVLRIATALSNGDVSLKNNAKYISFSRPVRKWMMDTLECIPGSLPDEMLKYRERWLRIGERLHPRSFPVDEYERIIDAFDMLRNNDHAIVSYSSKVARAFEENRFDVLVQLLTKRPGYFARELHHLFKSFPDKHYDIAVAFAGVANNVSTTVLLQVRSYYKNKCFLSDTGIYFPKGNTQNIFVKTDLPVIQIHSEICNLVVIACEYGLATQFRERYANEVDETKKVYIDPELKKCLIPTSMRSAGKSLKTLPRGSRIKLNDAKYLRAFIHWTNNENRVDVDLSVAFLDDEYKLVDRVSYYELRNKYSVHSGDFTNAPTPNGACEFVDVDLSSSKMCGVQYAVITVHSFTQDYWRNIPDCYVGYMLLTEEEYHAVRKNHQLFVPEHVEMKLNLANDSTDVVVCAVDTERNDIIWCDVAGDSHHVLSVPNNVDNHQLVISYIIQSIVEQKRANMYLLAKLTSEAKRHAIVDTPEEADIIYTVHSENIENKTVISAFDSDIWLKMV
jgi:hypothetical protein